MRSGQVRALPAVRGLMRPRLTDGATWRLYTSRASKLRYHAPIITMTACCRLEHSLVDPLKPLYLRQRLLADLELHRIRDTQTASICWNIILEEPRVVHKGSTVWPAANPPSPDRRWDLSCPAGPMPELSRWPYPAFPFSGLVDLPPPPPPLAAPLAEPPPHTPPLRRLTRPPYLESGGKAGHLPLRTQSGPGARHTARASRELPRELPLRRRGRALC